ncbi:MAG TPA: hypothetical protein VM580_04725 [Labilithrix sp.]|jgi:hypothetical protein|nr:hypothetical protein [Labilithrix sp.]
MSKFRETVERLVAGLAGDIMAVIRDAPLTELAALTANGTKVRPNRPVVKVARAKSATKKRASAPSKPPSVVRDDAAAMGVAQRFFEERGQRGATPPQLAEALAAQGLAQTSDAAHIIKLLIEQGVINDAGFRRTTGSGTAPVYVFAGTK